MKISFLDFEFMSLLLNLTAFIISIETEALLLTLAKSIYERISFGFVVVAPILPVMERVQFSVVSLLGSKFQMFMFPLTLVALLDTGLL